MQAFFIILAAFLVLYVAMFAAVIRALNKWGRDMDERAALGERRHQEDIIASMMNQWRRREDHERR